MQAAADPALVKGVAAACGLSDCEDRVQVALLKLAKLQPSDSEETNAAAEAAGVLPPALQQLFATSSTMLALPPMPQPLPPSAAAPAVPAPGEGVPLDTMLPLSMFGDVAASLTPESLALPPTATPFGTCGAANVMAALQATSAEVAASSEAGERPGGTRRVRQRLA